MASVTFDKKQLPQVVALGVLTLGIFGYFASKTLFAPATQASPVPPTGSTPGNASIVGGSSSAGTFVSPAASLPDPNAIPDPSSLIGADAPTNSMRDPFIPATPLSELTAPVAVLPKAPSVTGGQISDVPGLGQIKPLPLPGSGGLPGLGNASGSQQAGAAPDTAAWQVTGIIQSDSDPSNAIAILRDASSRRYLRLGDQLDPETRMVGIDRNSVTLIRSGQRIQLNVSSTIPEEPGQGAVPVQSTSTSTPESHPVQAVPVVTQPVEVHAAPVPIVQPVQVHAALTPKLQAHMSQQSHDTQTQSYTHGPAD
jgi:hypothetical protein